MQSEISSQILIQVIILAVAIGLAKVVDSRRKSFSNRGTSNAPQRFSDTLFCLIFCPLIASLVLVEPFLWISHLGYYFYSMIIFAAFATWFFFGAICVYMQRWGAGGFLPVLLNAYSLMWAVLAATALLNVVHNGGIE